MTSTASRTRVDTAEDVVAPWIEKLPTEQLRKEAQAAKEASAELSPADRIERALAERATEAEAARRELHRTRSADRWRMWCSQVTGDLSLYADDRANPDEYVRQPFAWWLSTLDARQYPQRIAAWLADPEARTLVLVGGTGTGKTKAAIAAGYAAAGQGVHTRFISQLDYLLALRPGGTDHPGDFRERYMGTGLLILDDLGAETEDATQFVRQEIVALLDSRLRQDRRQIITTNLMPDVLADAFGDRTVSRLRDRAVVLPIEGDDRRNLARAPW